MIFEITGRRFDIFNPKNIFVAYLFLQTGGYVAYTIASGSGFKFLDLRSADEMHWMALGLTMTIFGVIGFYFGYYFIPSKSVSRSLPRLQDFSPKRAGITIYFAVPFALYAAYIAFFADHGLSGYIENFVAIRYGTISTKGYLIYFATSFLSLLAVLGLIVAGRLRGRAIWRRLSYAFYFLALLTTALTGFRAALVPVLLMGAGWYHYCVHYFNARRTVIFVVCAFAGLSVYGVGRQMLEANLSGVELDANASSSIVSSVATRSPGAEIIAITMRKIAQGEKYQCFYPALYEALTILIPRSMWDEKPTPQSIIFGQRFMDYYLFLRDGSQSENTGGYSMTAIGYLYWQLGVCGVLIGMAAFGWALRVIWMWLLGQRERQSAVYGMIVLAAFLSRFAEAPQDAMNSVVITGLFVTVIIIICGGGTSRTQNRIPFISSELRERQCGHRAIGLMRKQAGGKHV